jgi:hypothetical protein
MRKILIALMVLVPLVTTAFACDYRVEPLCTDKGGLRKGGPCLKSSARVDFVFPPHSNLKFDNGRLRRGYRYHFVRIGGLSSDYRRSVAGVAKAEYYHSRRENGEESGSFTKCSAPADYCAYSLFTAPDGSRIVVIRIDYNALLNDFTNVGDNLDRMSLVLLSDLYQKGETGETSWAPSISQDIVEKVFDMIPLASEESLARYVSRSDPQKSYVLLNPKIILRVDTVERDEKEGSWNYRLLGTVDIRINRDKNGFLTQNSFFQDINVRPGNLLPNGGKFVLQAGTGDIQFSQTLRTTPYIFLNQINLKHNSKSNDPGACDQSDDNDRILCNSQLWHFDDLTQVVVDKQELKLNPDAARYFSSFGFRNLINPMIEIWICGSRDQIPLRTNFLQLSNQSPIPSSARIYRLWKKRYHRVRGDDLGSLILLPSDRITF